ncbi:hypothetical protein HOF65_00220 [bacterium]|nr:hypothetical protein [bacterium]MBT3852475.1 hypothetical protein [bacterium]MBT4632639.1 hypothetical protein [bacterium]MBT6778341.1 hypothetical protein [bacterium]
MFHNKVQLYELYTSCSKDTCAFDFLSSEILQDHTTKSLAEKSILSSIINSVEE